jgi:acetolactate synthase-1/2/3 large subunit
VLLPDADVVLVVGSRFAPNARQPWRPRGEQTIIQLDIDPDEIGRNRPAQIRLVADAKAGLAQLLERVPRFNHARTSRADELRAVQERARALFDGLQPQASFGAAIRAELPDDGILVSEVTQMGFWAEQAFPVYRPRTLISPGYQGTLGFGFGTALGAKVGNPDRPVVSINGDGGFGYQMSELATMAHHNIGVVAIVFNDNAYGNVKRTQKYRFEGRVLASELTNPDYMKLADAFGIAGARATTPEELRRHLRDALSSNRPALIEVPLGEVPPHWDLKLT